MPGWQTSCSASLLAVALTLIHRFHPYPGTRLLDTYQLEEEYDFVVIGAGSAGCVVANRLSEEKDWTVLLVEAGGPETEISQIPILARTQVGTDVDWKFRTAPPTGNQRYCLAMNNHECAWPRGKVVGGSSVLNTMLYVRGNRHDFDQWEALGNQGWSYDHVLKYFLKSENNSNPTLLETLFHAGGGYLSVQDLRFITPLAEAFVKAGEYFGYQFTDINGENLTGFTIPQATCRDGSRCSTAKAFIVPVINRLNLNLSMYSTVTRINFEDQNSIPRAKSVTFVKNGKEYTVKVRKEVVLSAGSINSPQILMLSGIGPNRHLQELGIKSVVNLEVGENLQDHVTSFITFKTDFPVTLTPWNSMTPDTIVEYFLKNEGPLTSISGNEAIGYVNTEYFQPPWPNPDVQFLLNTLSTFNANQTSSGEAYNIRPDFFNGTGFENLQNSYLFSISTLVLKPESRGRITLRSDNPVDQLEET